jgi:hypothetical protein
MSNATKAEKTEQVVRSFTDDQLASMNLRVRPSDGKIVKIKSARTSKIKYGSDANANTEKLLLASMDRINAGYQGMLQVLNGKATRSKTEYQLEGLSGDRWNFVNDSLLALHQSVMAQLKAGVRSVTTAVVMPK